MPTLHAGGSDHPHSEHPMPQTGEPASDALGGPAYLNDDTAPQFVEFAFQVAGELVHRFGRLGREDVDQDFTAKHQGFGVQIGRVAVGFEGVEEVAQ